MKNNLTFNTENKESGILGFYFTKIYQVLNEVKHLALTTSTTSLT